MLEIADPHAGLICGGCQRRWRDLPAWTGGAVTRLPQELESFATACWFGPFGIRCQHCAHVQELDLPHVFLVPNDAVIVAIPAASQHNPQDGPAAASRTVHVGRASSRQALIQAMLPAIERWCHEVARQEGMTDNAPPVDSDYFSLALLVSLGALTINFDGTSFQATTRDPPASAEEARALHQAAVTRGGVAMAGAIRRATVAAPDLAALAPLRQLVPPLESEWLPLRATFAMIVDHAGALLAEGGATSLPELAALAIISHAADIDTPLRAEWSAALLHAEAERPLEATIPLLAPEIIAHSIDPTSALNAATERAAAANTDYYQGTEPGRRTVGALVRLLGAEAAQHWREPMVDLTGPDGAPPDLAAAMAKLDVILAHLPDDRPLSALLRAARHYALDTEALLLEGARRLRHAGIEAKVAFAAEVGRVLIAQPQAVLATLDALALPNLTEPGAVFTVGSVVAEAKRNLGQVEPSLALWRSLAQTAPGDGERRQAMQGIGSCLRMLGRLDEAEAMLRDALRGAQGRRRVMLTNALATTLLDAGRLPDARAALESALDTLRAQPSDWMAFTQFTSMYAQILWGLGEHETARPWIEIARRSAIATGNQVHLGAMLSLLGEAEQFEASLVRALQTEGIPEQIVFLAFQVSSIRRRRGDHDGADTALRQAAEHVEYTTSSTARPAQYWAMLVARAQLAALREDFAACAALVRASAAALEALLATVGAAADPEALLSSLDESRASLSSLALVCYLSETLEDAEARSAMDVGMAPVLTARLRYVTQDAPALTTAAVQAFWAETPCALIQVGVTGGEIWLLFSRPDRSGHELITAAKLDIEAAAALRTVRTLGFFVKHRMLDGTQADLAGVRGWPELSDTLNRCMAEFAGSWRLVICPGILGSLCFTLALDPPWQPTFVPSLAALLVLRARRRALPGGLGFVPRRFGDFAVWLQGDQPSVIAALQDTEADGRQIAANHGLTYTARIGGDATEPALVDLLCRNELVRIACHGRLDPAAGVFELMVAADGELPPRTLIEQDRPSVRAHRLDRRRLQELSGIAPYVVASACCSGAVIFTPGGERIGLERALFIAGSVAIAAPQWDVDAAQMRDQLAAVLDTWFNNEAAGLDAVVSQMRQIGIMQGIRPAIACALAVFGDGLGREEDISFTSVIGLDGGRVMSVPNAIKVQHVRWPANERQARPDDADLGADGQPRDRGGAASVERQRPRRSRRPRQ